MDRDSLIMAAKMAGSTLLAVAFAAGTLAFSLSIVVAVLQLSLQ